MGIAVGRQTTPAGAPRLSSPAPSRTVDSFARPEWSEEHAAARDKAWVFTAPNNTHNTLGFDECAIGVRNAWVMSPTSPPDPTKCAVQPELEFR